MSWNVNRLAMIAGNQRLWLYPRLVENDCYACCLEFRILALRKRGRRPKLAMFIWDGLRCVKVMVNERVRSGGAADAVTQNQG